MIGKRTAVNVDKLGTGEFRRCDLDAVLVDCRAGAAHLIDKRHQRATEGDNFIEPHSFQYHDAGREECFRGGVRIDNTIVGREHEDGMGQRGEQQIVLNRTARRRGELCCCGGLRHAASFRVSS